MKNIKSGSACNSSSIINTEGMNFDCKRVVKFSHKWLHIIEPTQFLPSTTDEINDAVANDPLLALLCLLVEEKAEIPDNCYQLYEEGLGVLLKKWDDRYQIEGDRLYKALSLQQKQDLLSIIALKTFEQGEYFFKDDIQGYITDYLCNLHNTRIPPEVLQCTSEAVLKSIVLQHKLLVEQAPGVYSFSDLKFHQYFVAREIGEISNPQVLEETLKHLLSHISEQRWHGVFLQVVSMLRCADHVLNLMKQQTDAIVTVDRELQRFLLWLNQRSISGKVGCKPSAFRAFYLEFILDISTEDLFEDILPDYYGGALTNVDSRLCELIDFPFTEKQKVVLQQYYDANQLLIDCLRHARYVTHSVRTEIKETLLVPSLHCS